MFFFESLDRPRLSFLLIFFMKIYCNLLKRELYQKTIFFYLLRLNIRIFLELTWIYYTYFFENFFGQFSTRAPVLSLQIIKKFSDFMIWQLASHNIQSILDFSFLNRATSAWLTIKWKGVKYILRRCNQINSFSFINCRKFCYIKVQTKISFVLSNYCASCLHTKR